MNFAHDSLKLKSKVQNEDFCFDIETAQGHFFAVLDFAPHDYANLNATLKGKLETVVGSFASLSKFSDDLFLGFVAKEINNFLHHLGEQSSGPEILCSAALCLVGGNRLSYLLCGNVRIDITGGRLLSLSGVIPAAGDGPTEAETLEEAGTSIQELAQLGTEKLGAPLTDRVQSFTLLDDDVVLIMTHGLEIGFDRQPAELVGDGSSDPNSICEALMNASASSTDDRTVVVIAGPYERGPDLALSDLNKAIGLLEARVNALAEGHLAHAALARDSEREANDVQKDRLMIPELEALKVELAEKAGSADLLAFDGKLKTLTDQVAQKADSADVLGLKQDVSKLSKVATRDSLTVEPKQLNERKGRPLPSWLLLVILVAAIGAGFLGAWLQSRVSRKTAEVWTVKTSGNQIVIRRLDGNLAEPAQTITMNVAEHLTSTGEQTFSSFADVSLYIDRLTNPSPASSPAQANLPTQPDQNSEAVTEITVQPGDSLKKFAERYQVAQDRIKELNPTILKWSAIQIGQRIKIPSATPPAPTTPSSADVVAAQPSPASSSGTIEITVGPGDSINRFVQRYNSTPARLKELNPQITNWAQIRTGQKVLVPAPPG